VVEVDSPWSNVEPPNHNPPIPIMKKREYLHALDDTDGNGLSHVTNSKTSKRGVVGKRFDTHWLLGNKLDNG
jgi:hypothetical protein